MSILSRALRNFDEAVQKATTPSGSRNQLGSWVPNAPPQWGQPLATSADASGTITSTRMREIVEKTPTAGACLNAIVDFAGGVDITPRHINPAKKASQFDVDLVNVYLDNPNPRQTKVRFTKSLIRDLTTFGYAGVEKVQNSTGDGLASLYVLDNERILVDYDNTGKILGFGMFRKDNGQTVRGPDGVHGWEPDEVIWFVRDEMSSRISGISRIQQLFALGVLESMILNYMGNFFDPSNIPYGMLDLGELSNDELQMAVDTWNDQLSKNPQHRIVFMNSRGGSKWWEFNHSLKDLDARELLAVIRMQIMGILGVTMNELGESQDINKSNGYNLSFVFKKRAVEPLLTEICQTLSKFLVQQTLGLSQMKLGYEEIDSRDELLSAQIYDTFMKIGILSINQVNNERGKPNVPGGEEPMVFTGRDWIPVSLIRQFAEVQLQTLQLTNAQILQAIMNPQPAGDGTGQVQVKPPRVLGTALPSAPGAPGSVGNPGATVRLPQPDITPVKGQNQAAKGARGPVQAARNNGIRKEDVSG